MGYKTFDDESRIQIADLVLAAKTGDEDALLVLLERCMPVINKFSKLPDGNIDEDLKQHLIMAWLKSFHKFELSRCENECTEETVKLQS